MTDTTKQPAKAPRDLDDDQLDDVAGGINPQPVPPRRPTPDPE